MYKNIVLNLLFIFCLTLTVQAQLCEGSLGDPVVEIDFGSGSGRGSALGTDITAFTYTTGYLDEGQYTIANTTNNLKQGNPWHITTDHTGNTNGYMMVINSDVLAEEGIFYTKTVNGLCSETTYEFSAWVMNIMNPSFGTDQNHPNITFRISDTSGNILGSYNTGDINQSTSGMWIQYGFYFTLEADTEVVITMLNSAPSSHPGNDIALDDIAFRPCGPTITNSIDGNSSSYVSVCQDEIINSTLETNISDGYSDPRYQWQYSGDNGIIWTDITGENSENLLITDSSNPETLLYRVTIANGDNINSLLCRVASDEFTVEVIKKPDPLVGDALQSFCSTQNATLNDIEINADAVWYDSLTKNNILPDTTLLVDGITYYATQINNGCESDEVLAVSITIYSPTLAIYNVEDFVCDDLNDDVETVDLTVYETNITSCSDCSFSYFLTKNDAENHSTNSQITSPNSYDWSIDDSILYVRIDAPDNCYQIAELSIYLVETPIIPINDYVGICQGHSYVTIDAGFGFDSYYWSTEADTQTIQISTEDIENYYSVTVTEDHGSFICSSTKEFEIIPSNTATISEIIVEDWTDSNNTITISLSDESIGDYEYSLDNINYQDNNTFTELTSGEYTVYVRDKNGCGITQDIVYILNYPKFFTPNNDGYHDTWSIKYSEIVEPTMRIKIFDRYGKLLKALNATSSWDGTYGGHQLPTSDYWFLITRANGKNHMGHFTLKR